jgi:hypothetical protein
MLFYFPYVEASDYKWLCGLMTMMADHNTTNSCPARTFKIARPNKPTKTIRQTLQLKDT